MTYAVLVGLVVCVAILAFYYGFKLKKVESELENAKVYVQKQTSLVSKFMQVIRRDADLEEFLDQLDSCDSAAEFGELLDARLHGTKGGNTRNVEKP